MVATVKYSFARAKWRQGFVHISFKLQSKIRRRIGGKWNVFSTVQPDVQRAVNIDQRYVSISPHDGKTQAQNIQIFVDSHVILYVF